MLVPLKQLQQLSISRHSKSGRTLIGTLPSFNETNMLLQLQFLLLDGNELTGTIPNTFLSSALSGPAGAATTTTTRSTIQLIDLSNNQLTGTIPQSLQTKLADPSQLVVSNNFITTSESDSHTNNNKNNERETLQSIYNACNGLYWYRNDFWNSNNLVSICDWYGVGCNNHGRVILLNLQTNNVTGILPPRVFTSLPYLQILWLQNNRQLTITFPTTTSTSTTTTNNKQSSLRDMRLDYTNVPSYSGIGNIQTLTSLNLQSTSSKGNTFPANEILKLSNLRTISISNNDMTGALPQSLYPMKYLRYFDASYNKLHGPIPSWKDNVVLTTVVLNNNQLTGAVPFDYLHGVQTSSSSSMTVPARERRGNLVSIQLQNNQLRSKMLPIELQQKQSNDGWNITL